MNAPTTKPKPAQTVENVLDELTVSNATLSAAMALAFAEIEGATKGAINPHFGKKYADLSAVLAAVKPALIKYGLFFTQRAQPSNDGVIVDTVLHHSSGEEMSLGSLYVPADKRDAQKFGSALSYARRYALMTAFGVPAEDDDGNAAATTVERPTTGETPPAKRVTLDGPYTCPTQLMTATREFVRTINGIGDIEEFTEFGKSEDTQAFLKQLKRDLPDWWKGGPSVPPEFVPVEILIAQRKRDLEQIAGLKERA